MLLSVGGQGKNPKRHVFIPSSRQDNCHSLSSIKRAFLSHTDNFITLAGREVQAVYVNGLTIYVIRALPCVRTQLDILNCRAAQGHGPSTSLSEDDIVVP